VNEVQFIKPEFGCEREFVFSWRQNKCRTSVMCLS